MSAVTVNRSRPRIRWRHSSSRRSSTRPAWKRFGLPELEWVLFISATLGATKGSRAWGSPANSRIRFRDASGRSMTGSASPKLQIAKYGMNSFWIALRGLISEGSQSL